ncbi:MAG: hypothetical protein WCI41_03705 [bacterium]
MDQLNNLNSQFNSPDTAVNPQIFNLDYLSVHIRDAVHSFFSINFSTVWHTINTIFFLLAIFFIYVLCYTFIRMLEIRKKEHAHLHHEVIEYAHHKAEREKRDAEKKGSPQSARWKMVQEHIASTSQGDWKLAIVDADVMLEDLLDQLGFKGENLGDKLKAVDMEKYSSLKNAWEAHLIRNQIAHEGLQYDLPEQEAKRVIAIYEQIFRDFRYI